MDSRLSLIISRLVLPSGGKGPLCGIQVQDFLKNPGEGDDNDAASLAAAFLLICAGGHESARAQALMQKFRTHPRIGKMADFFQKGLGRVARETQEVLAREGNLASSMDWAAESLLSRSQDADEELALVWEIFFPEGLGAAGGEEPRNRALQCLRSRRRVEVSQLNPNPLTDPLASVLITSNALLSIPGPGTDWERLDLTLGMKECLTRAMGSAQQYWYDHPIPIGVPAQENEVIYGLKGLARALARERERHPEWTQEPVTCLLSASVTHNGLQEVAREYLAAELANSQGLEGLDLVLFTEADTRRLKDEVLFPVLEKFFPQGDKKALDMVFGVDGEYGRHYSFLKAIAAFWAVLVDPSIRATFKIDLDQVFPQEELISQSGRSAWENFTTPLWGAWGRDWFGRDVELGLIAGALVNWKGISQGIYTPDVDWPQGEPFGEDWVFFSGLPQACSTRAEMMARYDGVDLDGVNTCLHRVHVTGGTSGILVESLRRHRPFTPTFIGRAEDQAYLLSVLEAREPALRYLHQPGLIMRHDKAGLIPETIAASKAGKLVGDYARLLWFSAYARVLPWGTRGCKAILDPFTGCFISRLPVTVVYLRLALRALTLLGSDGETERAQGVELLTLAASRLEKVMHYLESDPKALMHRYGREKKAWDLFYDLLDRLEDGLKRGEAFARSMRARARDSVAACRINSA